MYGTYSKIIEIRLNKTNGINIFIKLMILMVKRYTSKKIKFKKINTNIYSM